MKTTVQTADIKTRLGELSAVCAGQSMAGDIVDSHGDIIATCDDCRNAEELVKHHNLFAELVAALNKCEDVIGMARLHGKLSDNALIAVNDALIAVHGVLDKTRGAL